MEDKTQRKGCVRRLCRRPGGFTLVEVGWSCLLLSVLCIAAVSYATFAREMTEVTATRRAAMEAASSRLEDVRSSRYADIAPVVLSYETNYLTRSGGTWTRSLSAPGETVRVNDRTCPMVTAVRYVDIEDGSPGCDAVRVSVNIRCGRAAGGSVALETLVTP